MAHFAQLDENNVVINVLVLNNEDCVDEDGNESEAVGIAFCQSIMGADTVWKQTSYNHNMRADMAVSVTPTTPASTPSFYPAISVVDTEQHDSRLGPTNPDPSDENSPYAWHEDTLTWVEQDIS